LTFFSSGINEAPVASSTVANFEIPLPILFYRQPPSKLAPYESRISPAGNLEGSVRSHGATLASWCGATSLKPD
jgi:hypothetical protein